jgi:hypothetical protein
MISGTDIVIPVRDEFDALDFALRAVVRLWDDVVLEDAETGEVFSSYWEINLFGRHEILAFRDPEVARLWDDIGTDPSLDGTLIDFLLSPGELTVAVDDVPPPQIRLFVESLRAALRKDLFASEGERKVAA